MNALFIPRSQVPEEFADLDPTHLGWQICEWPIGAVTVSMLVRNERRPAPALDDFYEQRRIRFWLDRGLYLDESMRRDAEKRYLHIRGLYSEDEWAAIERYGNFDMWLNENCFEVAIDDDGVWQFTW